MKNPNLKAIETDYLYHLGLDSSQDLKGLFGDVKFVCMMGSALRIKDFAEKVASTLNIEISAEGLQPIGKTERCSLYKVGPVICVSHGMGAPSILIFLHELSKLIEYAGCEDVQFIRIGTSGGLGVEPGTVIVSESVLNGKLEPNLEQIGLGKTVKYPTGIHRALAESILASRGDIRAEFGVTMGTDDFYEGQGRMDGALLPPYTEEEKMNFLKQAHALGVRNIEMESTAFSAFCHRANIPAAVVCATFINRLNGDQVTTTAEEQVKFSSYADELVLHFLRSNLQD